MGLNRYLSNGSCLRINNLSRNAGWFTEASSSDYPENNKQTYRVMNETNLFKQMHSLDTQGTRFS